MGNCDIRRRAEKPRRRCRRRPRRGSIHRDLKPEEIAPVGSPPSKVPQLPAGRLGLMAEAPPLPGAAAEGDRAWPRSGHL